MPRSRSILTQEQIENPDKYDNTGVEDKSILHEIEFMSSTLETIDYAVYDYMNERMKLTATSNSGFKKIPIVWASAERSFQIKGNKDLRDKEETLILPMMTIERKSVTKDLDKRAIPYANIPPQADVRGGSITIARRINQKKTAEFQDNLARRKYADGTVTGKGMGQNTFPKIVDKRTVYETITIPLPVWVTATYEISLKSEYQQQMNDLVTPMIRQGGMNSMPHRLKRDGHKYEAFIKGDFVNNSNTNALEMNQRMYETVITMEVLGYLIGDGPNEEQPKVVVRENAVEVKIPREHVILGDINEYLSDEGFYRD